MAQLKRLWRWTRRLIRRLRWWPRKQRIPTLDLQEANRAAKLFYVTALFQRLEGRTLRFVREVARPPYFTVKKGTKGTVVGSCFDPEDGFLIVRVFLDAGLAGTEEFGGEVHWKEGINLEDFKKDVVLVLR